METKQETKQAYHVASKFMEPTFTIKAKEVAQEVGKSVQEVYSYLDISKQKHGILRKPIFIQGKDWDYIKGRIFFSEESVEILKSWVKTHTLKTKNKSVQIEQ